MEKGRVKEEKRKTKRVRQRKKNKTTKAMTYKRARIKTTVKTSK